MGKSNTLVTFAIQIQPMLRLNYGFPALDKSAIRIQIQPMLRLNPSYPGSTAFTFLYSNTTNVKVKLRMLFEYTKADTNSNTTNVKVKQKYTLADIAKVIEFKYNQC